MKIRRFLPFLAAATFAASSALAADTYVVDKGHSEATFQVRHMVSKVRGRFGDFEGQIRIEPGKPAASSVEFTVRTASLNSDNPDRDKHLKSADFFDVDTYPTLTFKSTRIAPQSGDSYDVTGLLTMRGISKQVTLPVTLLGFVKDPWGGERAGFETSVTLNRKDFGMVWSKTLDTGGLVVGEEALVTINLETVKQKATARN